ncbi:Uncharacterised protein [Vibrio cholerae]|nr:Uncharacterised protein [Vibrio cholerae]
MKMVAYLFRPSPPLNTARLGKPPRARVVIGFGKYASPAAAQT